MFVVKEDKKKNKSGLPEGMELGSLISNNNRGSLYAGKLDGASTMIQLTLGFESAKSTDMDYSVPENVIKNKKCRQSFYRNVPNKTEHNECLIYSNIYGKEVKVPEIELDMNETDSSTFNCMASKKEGNLRYIILAADENKFKPLSELIKSGVDPKAALSILQLLLKDIVHVNSYGLNAKHMPYSHNNINGNNVLLAQDANTKQYLVKVLNFSSAVPCENVEKGSPINNESMYTPPEYLVFEDFSNRAGYFKKVESKIKEQKVIDVCWATDTWAAGMLFVNLLTKGALTAGFANKYKSFVNQDINSDKMILEFLNWLKMDDQKILQELHLTDLFKGDKEQETKDKDLVKLIKGMFQRNPSDRMYPHDLLALSVFKKPVDAVAASKGKEGGKEGSASGKDGSGKDTASANAGESGASKDGSSASGTSGTDSKSNGTGGDANKATGSEKSPEPAEEKPDFSSGPSPADTARAITDVVGASASGSDGSGASGSGASGSGTSGNGTGASGNDSGASGSGANGSGASGNSSGASGSGASGSTSGSGASGSASVNGGSSSGSTNSSGSSGSNDSGAPVSSASGSSSSGSSSSGGTSPAESAEVNTSRAVASPSSKKATPKKTPAQIVADLNAKNANIEPEEKKPNDGVKTSPAEYSKTYDNKSV